MVLTLTVAAADCIEGEDFFNTPGAKVAAADAIRHRDQEKRNEGIRAEMARLHVAFRYAYFFYFKAKGDLAAAEGKLAALEALLCADQGQQVKITGQVRNEGDVLNESSAD
jgi:hypothetical protein